jgi:hypothetical protein
MAAGLAERVWPLVVLAAFQTPPPLPQPLGEIRDAAGPPALTVALEIVVRSARGQVLDDLEVSEVDLRQDGVPQIIRGFEYHAGEGFYEMSYSPRTGKPGPVSVRILRPGTTVGPRTGEVLRPRVIEAHRAFEAPLEEALDRPDAPRGVPFELGVLSFEQRAEGLHHVLVVEMPLKSVRIEDARRARVAMLVRVKTAAGHVVRRLSLDSPIEAEEGPRVPLDIQRFVWTGHAYLGPGAYLVEAAVLDRLGSGLGVARVELPVPPAREGPRLSSVTVLQAGGALQKREPDADDPLQIDGEPVVPTLRPSLVAGSEAELSFYAMVYAASAVAEPPQLMVQVYGEGRLVGQTLTTLPAGKSAIRYRSQVPVRTLPPGSYEIRLQVSQSGRTAEAKAGFQLQEPPRVHEPLATAGLAREELRPP